MFFITRKKIKIILGVAGVQHRVLFLASTPVTPVIPYTAATLVDTQLTADLKRVILEKMEGKYDNDATQKMTRKAKLLDPRYRGDHMKPPELSNLKKQNW